MSTATQFQPTATDLLPRTFGMFILYVNAWDQAVSFYRDTLGWELKGEAHPGWAEFQTGGLTFALHSSEPGKPAQAKDTGLCLFADDLDGTLETLRARGVKIVSEPRSVCDSVRSCLFSDPFGNLFHLAGH